jgi:aspartate racemase
MGPAATLDFFARVLAATPAERDQEHLRLIIDDNPTLPDRNLALAGKGPSPGPALAAMARGLEVQGADFLVMPCNTAHAWQAEIEAAIRIPFVSLIEETVAAVAHSAPKARRVGLLATLGGRTLYEPTLAARGYEVIACEGEAFERQMALIYRIKTGDVGPEVRRGAASLARWLAEAGAEVVLAACTEIPLVMGPGDLDVPFLDATEVLVARTIAYALGESLPQRRLSEEGGGIAPAALDV